MTKGRLSGKAVLVTGTGGGIGRATALVCAREGAHVVGVDLNGDAAAETVEKAREQGGRMDTVAPVDLATEDGAKQYIAQALEFTNKVDVLVNNASAIRFGPIDELSFADWSFTIRHELDIVFLVTKAAWPHLRRSGSGSVVNVGSIAGSRGAFFMPQNAHGAAKGGVLALTYQLAVEGGPHGIRVNAVSPAMTETPQTRPLLMDPDGPAEAIRDRVPLRRWGQPEDVAHAILFLASAEASHVTGANIPVDGGAAAIG
jgi:NAD(P)-dependent dehydrogenase (short-subunit alcohol dehydrogenase family)